MTDTPRSHPDTTTPHQAQTPATDNQCQQPPTKRARNQQSIVRDAAAAAARYLSSLGHGQLSSHRRVITYNTIEPLHCCDGWGASTPRLRALHLYGFGFTTGDTQCNPRPRSEHRNMVGAHTGRGKLWNLATGGRLVHPSDALLEHPGHAPGRRSHWRSQGESNGGNTYRSAGGRGLRLKRQP